MFVEGAEADGSCLHVEAMAGDSLEMNVRRRNYFHKEGRAGSPCLEEGHGGGHLQSTYRSHPAGTCKSRGSYLLPHVHLGRNSSLKKTRVSPESYACCTRVQFARLVLDG